MSLYLKYRPKTIEELDLASVRKTLGEMVVANRIAHAYLFTGPRGAGKTSAARILARVINCEKNGKKLSEPCNECEACQAILAGSAVDVVEIDAASNRGIDDIRELKERIRLSPAILRKKVYIIDEVHMLTTEAFNALLKTLEEPPDHAVFILCTTESHKVPETIASRCVRVNFTKATAEEMKRSFARVVMGEKAVIEELALETIVAAVDGSFRDGVKILDTVLSLGKKIAVSEVEVILFGSAGYKSQDLSRALVGRDAGSALNQLYKAVGNGVDLMHLLTSVMQDLRKEVLEGKNVELVGLVYKLDEVARKITTSPVPVLLIEMAIIEWCGSVGTSDSPTGGKKKGQEEAKKPKEAVKTEQAKEIKESKSDEVAVVKVVEQMVKIDPAEAWGKLIASLNGDSYSLGALLSKARPGIISGNTLTIEVLHDFHREQLMQPKFRSRVEKLIGDVVGTQMIIDCKVVKDKLQTNPQVDSIAGSNLEEAALMQAAEEIFNN